MRILAASLLLCALLACTSGARQGDVVLPPLATRTAVPAPAELASDPVAAPTAVPATALPVQGSAPTPSPRVVDHRGVPDGARIPIEVLAGDRAWLVGVRSADPAELVGVREVVDPSGVVRYKASLRREVVVVDDLDGRVIADAGAVGLYVPAPDGDALVPGTWEVVVATNGDAVDVGVAITHGDPDVPRVLDVAVWATADVDATAVAAGWRASMDEVLAPHRLSIGRLDVVTAGDEGAAFVVLGVDGLAEDVHEACTAAHAATGADLGTAVVVLAGRIGEGVLTARTDGGGAPGAWAASRGLPDSDIGGFTASTPGTPVVGPPSHACAAVSAGQDPVGRGLVALHEILHLAGIPRHTTEEDGRGFDDIADTPECPADVADVDRDGRVTAAECEGLGHDNLMFWAEGGTTLTPGQAWRVRWHPLLTTR